MIDVPSDFEMINHSNVHDVLSGNFREVMLANGSIVTRPQLMTLRPDAFEMLTKRIGIYAVKL